MPPGLSSATRASSSWRTASASPGSGAMVAGRSGSVTRSPGATRTPLAAGRPFTRTAPSAIKWRTRRRDRAGRAPRRKVSSRAGLGPTVSVSAATAGRPRPRWPRVREERRARMRRAVRDEPADAAGAPARADVRARDQPAHAGRHDVDPRGTRRALDAVERRAQAMRALLDVTVHRGVGDGVEVAPPVAPEAAREPEEVGGVLCVAMQQDDGRVRVAGIERPYAAAAEERERSGEGEERRGRALGGERPGARRPGCAVLFVRRAGGRMAPAVARRPRVGADVEERARCDDGEDGYHPDARERRHA